MTTFEHRLDNSNKRRKYDHSDSGTLESVDPEVGWHLLQPILENDVLNAKIPTSSMAFDLLTKWFQIIVGDQDKLSLFRQWIKTSSEEDDTSPKKIAPSPTQSSYVVPLADIKKDEEEPATPPPPPSSSTSVPSDSSAPSITISTSPNKVASIDFINNEIPITPRSTPQVLLLQQLLQQQQKQIVLLQKLKAPTDAVVPTANTITLSSSSGSAGVVLTVNIKGNEWHAFSDTCSCTCGFTTADGVEATSNRIPGGNEGEMRFVVPPISFPSHEVTQMPMTVHLTSCSAPHSPLVCVDSFMYGRERQSANSDSDSEDTPDSSVCDDEENDEDSSEQSPVAASLSSPKQLMTIRERMVEFLQAPKGTARVMVVQQPPSRVVWKNRRLDTPFKVRVDGVQCDTPATKLAALALVVDHKNKLQIDAMENCEEECSPQGVALFHNLRMTKGTWGKEWSITFVMVVKSTMTTSAPVVVGVSQPCPVVVKTRKNPQVRHITRSDTSRSDPPSPVAFVERLTLREKPDTSIRLKRNRVEDILDHPNQQSRTSSNSRPGLHSEAMSNLLYAAEIKQHEREFRVVHHPMPPTALSSSSSASPSPASSPSPPQSNLMLPSIQSSFVNPENNFANLQGLLGFLEEIKLKLHPSLVIIEQPQLKRDGKVLIVKKGKPFRTPFRLQMRVAQRGNFHSTPEYNPQQYVCVAVLRNDKGEEVALKNNEVSFDSRGLATFSGLMVMKGTWGKTVQLTFEARWSGARRIVGSNWPPLRMLVVAETSALQLMCYTKDKKTPSAV